MMNGLIEEMNRSDLAFVLHIGDIHSGATPCTDAAYRESARRFALFEDPIVYTPGDNDWMDCERTGSQPRERLRYLRQEFFTREDALGSGALGVRRQSARYPENVSWVYEKVTFVTVHNVGGNNNSDADPIEYRRRNDANLEWLQEGFDLARSNDSESMVIATHADPGFESQPPESGFKDLLGLLATESARFAKPVLLVHGDTHLYRVDQPLMDPANDSKTLANFTRAETFGSPFVAWLRVSVEPGSPQTFSVRAEQVGVSL